MSPEMKYSLSHIGIISYSKCNQSQNVDHFHIAQSAQLRFRDFQGRKENRTDCYVLRYQERHFTIPSKLFIVT